MKQSISVPTNNTCQLIDITSEVQKLVSSSHISEGIVTAFVAHTTAGITINENADPDVKHDILLQLENMVPQSDSFLHGEGNSPGHIKASMMGSSVSVIISGGRLQLGTWQGIYFCEFDGPRSRTVWLKIIEG